MMGADTPDGSLPKPPSSRSSSRSSSRAEPGVLRKVRLFSMVLGHDRRIWGRFCPNQTLETVIRCHIAALDAMGGAFAKSLYDRIKTAVISEAAAGVVTCAGSLMASLARYGSAAWVCQPYRAKTSAQAARPFRANIILSRGGGR